ncbi:MAG: hypothetical protein ACM3TN_05385 [Alphaproteobacteria bacterium]
MSTPQGIGISFFYAAVTVLGAVYALFELHRAAWLGDFIMRLVPVLLIIVLLVIVYGFFRSVFAVLNELKGVCWGAHATLYANYEKTQLG